MRLAEPPCFSAGGNGAGASRPSATAGGLGLDDPKTTPRVPVLSEVEGSLVRRGGGTGETPDLNWQQEAHGRAGSVPANAAASRNRVVPGLLLVLPIISRLPATVEVGFDSRKASLRGEKIEKENN